MASKGFTPTLTNGDIAVPAAPNDYAVRVDEEVRALRAGAGGAARVRVVATSNVALSSGLENGDTIDGVSLVTGDLVLLAAQSTAAQCGIYAVVASGAASRALGFEAYNTYCGLLVVVQEGTANADTIWRGTSNRGGTIDSTALVFAKYGTEFVRSDATANLTAGYTTTSVSAGTKSSGTFTPDPTLGNVQHATNGGAHTLAPPSSTCSMIIEYTNNGSAGAITTSGFTAKKGDSFTTTNGHKFICSIVKSQNYSLLVVQALQ